MIEFGYYETFKKKMNKLAYQLDESNHNPPLFWESASEYTSNNVDAAFINEMAYLLVTLYRSEVP